MSDTTLTLSDVLTGLAASLALDGIQAVSRSAFHPAMVRSLPGIAEEAALYGLKLLFNLRLHPIHAESQVLADGIASAVAREVLSYDGPALRIRIQPEEASFYLDRLPGDPGLYRLIALRVADALRPV